MNGRKQSAHRLSSDPVMRATENPLSRRVRHKRAWGQSLDQDGIRKNITTKKERDEPQPKVERRPFHLHVSTNGQLTLQQEQHTLDEPLLKPSDAAALLSVRTSWVYEAVRARPNCLFPVDVGDNPHLSYAGYCCEA